MRFYFPTVFFEYSISIKTHINTHLPARVVSGDKQLTAAFPGGQSSKTLLALKKTIDNAPDNLYNFL
ncbi:MAG: hypothetical protein GX541_05450 [Clostridiales bacterium]|jgi:hypothetical protein|nr:hypothetical protein [Clostridiales bacterium]